MDERAPQDGSVLEPDVDPLAQARPVSADAEEPDLSKTAAAIESPKSRSLGITVLAVLALLYTLYFARDFLLPISFALLLSFLLSPLVRVLARVRIPPPIGSAIVMVVLLAVLGFGTYELARPVQSWAAKAPVTLAAVQRKLTKLRRPIERVTKTAEQVQSAATDVAGSAKTTEVVVREPSLTSRVFGTTQRLLAATMEVAFLLYFLLAAGDLFLQKLIKVLPNVRDKRKAVEIARETESSISTYLLTALVVNVLEGVVVAFAMYLLGMPNAALWGALVMLLEFIPYVGAATMVVILGVAAITTFDSLGHALLVPATFLIINLVQANIVSPMLLGHRLALNPVALFVGLTFWFWIWGIPGAFIAVPLLATFKIFCDHIETLASVGEFLGTRDENERRAIVR
ncbi:MAG: AI-2E family transporter [Gemmatimonadaceae bacterium]